MNDFGRDRDVVDQEYYNCLRSVCEQLGSREYPGKYEAGWFCVQSLMEAWRRDDNNRIPTYPAALRSYVSRFALVMRWRLSEGAIWRT